MAVFLSDREKNNDDDGYEITHQPCHQLATPSNNNVLCKAFYENKKNKTKLPDVNGMNTKDKDKDQESLLFPTNVDT